MEHTANVYIDVGYVVAACELHDLDHTRLNLAQLGGQAARFFGWSRDRVYIYDGVKEGEGSEAYDQRQAWLMRCDREDGCHYRRGRIASAKREQKRVDVQLAVDVLRDIRSARDPANVVLITGDDDFTPLLEAVREYGPQLGLVLFPKYGGTDDLRRAADAVRVWEFGNAAWKDAYRDQPFV